MQIAVYTGLSVVLGLLLGALAPFAARPFLPGNLAEVALISIYPSALIEAAVYGCLAAAIFSIWPLAQTEHIRPANLFRGGAPASGPRGAISLCKAHYWPRHSLAQSNFPARGP